MRNPSLIQDLLYGWTPLHLAARYQSAEAFMALVNKVSPEALNTALVIQNSDGMTPLHLAVKEEKASIVLFLIEKIDIKTLD